jgi:hypothetical protein
MLRERGSAATSGKTAYSITGQLFSSWQLNRKVEKKVSQNLRRSGAKYKAAKLDFSENNVGLNKNRQTHNHALHKHPLHDTH